MGVIPVDFANDVIVGEYKTRDGALPLFQDKHGRTYIIQKQPVLLHGRQVLTEDGNPKHITVKRFVQMDKPDMLTNRALSCARLYNK